MGERGEVHSELRFHFRKPSSYVVVVILPRSFKPCEQKEGGKGIGGGGGGANGIWVICVCAMVRKRRRTSEGASQVVLKYGSFVFQFVR